MTLVAEGLIRAPTVVGARRLRVNLYTVTSSRILISRHDHVLSLISIYNGKTLAIFFSKGFVPFTEAKLDKKDCNYIMQSYNILCIGPNTKPYIYMSISLHVLAYSNIYPTRCNVTQFI